MARIRELSVGYILNSNLPFTIFESTYLQELFRQLDSDHYIQVPWGRTATKKDLEDILVSKKAAVKEELDNAVTQIHLSFDLWTSPNRQIGSHAGENIAYTIRNVVRDWGIDFHPSLSATHRSFKAHAREQEEVDTYKLAEESTAEAEVIQNNATRWNSTYMMIERALVKQSELNSFIQELGLEADASKRVPTADILTSDDWKVLREVLYEDETADPAAEEWYTTQGEEAGPAMGVTSTLSRPPTVGQIRERPSRQSRLPSRLQGYEITPLRRRRETTLPARPPASSVS
uniref:HAT C-terminal dimerisation domain-containing protein n=1 Tax=Fusarium oxysporum (strain Fo5176) TaxID=660025 RepID=A0A0D2YIE2_FUSOF